MKHILILLTLVTSVSLCHAQYSKEKLTDIIAGSSVKAWTIKSSNTVRAEKSFAFNKNLTVEIAKNEGAAQTEKWALSSVDDIRWFVTIGNQKYELIVSYDRSGNQFLKLTSQAGDKTSVYNEIILFPVK